MLILKLNIQFVNLFESLFIFAVTKPQTIGPATTLAKNKKQLSYSPSVKNDSLDLI